MNLLNKTMATLNILCNPWDADVRVMRDVPSTWTPPEEWSECWIACYLRPSSIRPFHVIVIPENSGGANDPIVIPALVHEWAHFMCQMIEVNDHGKHNSKYGQVYARICACLDSGTKMFNTALMEELV